MARVLEPVIDAAPFQSPHRQSMMNFPSSPIRSSCEAAPNFLNVDRLEIVETGDCRVQDNLGVLVFIQGIPSARTISHF
jgi:hypothetical protein